MADKRKRAARAITAETGMTYTAALREADRRHRLEREHCDQDDGGLRKCCSTAQLGPHRDDCPKSASFQEGMRDHEETYRHAMEAE